MVNAMALTALLLSVAAMEKLVARIETLMCALPHTIAATMDKQSCIAHVLKFQCENNDTPTTFNRRMDLLFGEDLRNANGWLPNILCGTCGLPLVVKYLRGIEWGEVKAEIVRLKLNRLIRELEAVSDTTVPTETPNTK
ncbi:hypothetical protein K438DRAFT_1208275 [Mycena galopus ATCC 62051]|nr:hypothetical protein K438DRAFT_1208275 [Mycena galopus ATCC 62051]